MGKAYEEKVKQALSNSISKKDSKKIKKANKSTESSESKAADVRGKRFDKKFMKYAGSKESQLHAKDFEDGINKADKRAMKEVLFDSGYIDEVGKFAKGGRAGYKSGSKGCKMATKGKGRAYGMNS